MPAALVTGAARGIGRAIAIHLAATGWDVIAGVRTPEDGAAGRAADPRRISSVLLDVTDLEQVAALDDSLPDRLDAVVNNAGVVVGGPMETVSAAELRRQLEVNVVGQLAVTQAVLPRLRRSRGRVVFISSVNGRISFPLLGPYSASKFAIEAAADALRMELRPWHIAVVVVEPAQTDTEMWRTAEALADDAAAAMSSEQRGLYGRHLIGLKKSIPMMQRLAGPPEKVAAVVTEALTARRPRARYVVGVGPKLQVAVVTRLPAAVRDPLLRFVASQPGHR
jgi:NAD(P)-dependent dehydrogenase (short-subunit alcohol dehydrogenase family)